MRLLPFLMVSLPTAAIAACSNNVTNQGSGGTTTTATTSTKPTQTTSTTGAGGATTTSMSSSGGGALTTSSSTASSSTSSTSSSGGTGGVPNFIEELKAGPWMLGWSGGLDHYSFVRFNFVNATQGSVDVVDAECASCTDYFGCEGQGLFSADPSADSLVLQLPQGCNNTSHDIAFIGFAQAGGFPSQATLLANVTDNGNNISGYRFPPSFCDAAFKMCGDPFQ